MKTILSLFDNSGNWSEPFWQRGWNIVELDILNNPSIDIRDINFTWIYENVMDMLNGTVDGVLAAPPCTDFTNAGSRYWKKKDVDGTTEKAVELVYITLEIVECCQPDWWVLENPIGRIHKLVPELGKAKAYFNPCDYAGYVTSNEDQFLLEQIRNKPIEEMAREDVELVKRCNVYNKKTALWGEFTIPEKKRIEPINTSKHGSWLLSLGGKSQKTKSIRSVTPAGFSEAFCQANL